MQETKLSLKDRARLKDLERRVAALENNASKSATSEPEAPEVDRSGASWLFVRQARWAPPPVAARYDGVIVATRYDERPINRGTGYWRDLRERGVRTAGFDWLPLPGAWRPGLGAMVHFLRDVGAEAFCANIEPLPDDEPNRWEGKHDEARRYVDEARRLCDGARLEFWFSSWARPSARRSFPWAEFVPRAHVNIPQPYEVHGRSGPEYVADVLEQWRDLGARRIILGRGAHELDRSDDDAWRTVAEIAAHRQSTPAGMSEAWWPPTGDLARRPDLVEAMVG